jgi:hypothetical protein
MIKFCLYLLLIFAKTFNFTTPNENVEYFSYSRTKEITNLEELKKIVEDPNETSIAVFHAHWCGHWYNVIFI